MGYYGIKVVTPSSSTSFTANTIRSLHTHGTAHIGVQLGEHSSNAHRIHSNSAQIRANTDGQIREAAMQVWGSSNIIDLYSSNHVYRYGIKFESSSEGNTLINSGISAWIPVADYGTNNDVHGSGTASSSLSSVLPGESLETNPLTIGTTAAALQPTLL